LSAWDQAYTVANISGNERTFTPDYLWLKRGDLYLVGKYRILHRHNRVVSEPETCVAQRGLKQVVLRGLRTASIGTLWMCVETVTSYAVDVAGRNGEDCELIINPWVSVESI
jgi:hypothetical protein